MESLKKHSAALTFIAILIVLKFAVMPIYQWQQSTVANNALLDKRLTKSEFAIQNKQEMKAALTQLKKETDKIKEVVFSYQVTNKFQLAQQKRIESAFEDSKIQITNLSWQLPIQLHDWGLIQYEIKLRVNGEVIDMQKLQQNIESGDKWFDTSEFHFRLDKRRENRLGKASGRMSVKLYMQAQS